ncbi:DMT family transporter [Erysipelotrichaceae bacterium OttesenSCG-928-M19]|nr:DMT family transporter [Erysipelotrichaceae bacterium OttesenSCG-928-M19]
MKTWKANALLVIVAAIWGTGFIGSSYVLQYLEPFQMQVFRFGMASIIMSIAFYKKIINANRQTIIYGVIIGIVFFIAFTLQNYGLKETTIPKNAFISVTNVVWVPIIMYFIYKIKPKGYLFTGLFMMLIGFFFLMFDIDIFNLKDSLNNLAQQMNVNIGDFFSLLGAIVFAFRFILSSKFVKEEDPITILIFQLYVSTLLAFCFSMTIDGPNFVNNLSLNGFVDILPMLSYLAIVNSLIAYILLFTVQQYTSATNTAIICSLESLFASFFAVIIGTVALTSSLVIAAFIITFGIVLAETGFNFKRKS